MLPVIEGNRKQNCKRGKHIKSDRDSRWTMGEAVRRGKLVLPAPQYESESSSSSTSSSPSSSAPHPLPNRSGCLNCGHATELTRMLTCKITEKFRSNRGEQKADGKAKRMNEQGKHNLAETNKQTNKIQRAPKAMPVGFLFPIFFFGCFSIIFSLSTEQTLRKNNKKSTGAGAGAATILQQHNSSNSIGVSGKDTLRPQNNHNSVSVH